MLANLRPLAMEISWNTRKQKQMETRNIRIHQLALTKVVPLRRTGVMVRVKPDLLHD
jgi:hypothetical protein